MGKSRKKPEMKEIAETKAAAKDAAFDGIVARIENAGGTIHSDETHPMYTEVGMQELEIGFQRIVEFNLNKTDFQLIRNVETHSLQGSGNQKHLEELPSSRAKIHLKSKSETETYFQVVDLDDFGGLFS
jgi:hypothetical protein